MSTDIDIYYKLSAACLDRVFSNPVNRKIMADLELVWQLNGASAPSREFQVYGIDQCSPQVYFLVRRLREEPARATQLIQGLLPPTILTAIRSLWSIAP